MTDQQLPFRPVGVRSAGQRSAPVRWVEPGDLQVAVGDRVMIQEHGQEWLAQVVVAADRIVEAAPFGDLPRIVRPADPAGWPSEAARPGLVLLHSLDLPD